MSVMRCYLFAGQGTQKVGMGESLFARYAERVEEADEVLGFSIKALCLEGPPKKLSAVQYASPAVYVVNALSYFQLREEHGEPDVAMGHSLGEYNALLAAGAFDFAEGLRLVKERGEAMARISGGGAVAVVGLAFDRIRETLAGAGLPSLEIANYNTPEQTVVSGRNDEVRRFADLMEQAGAAMVHILDVGGPAHSSAMAAPTAGFREKLLGVSYKKLQFPVIANATAESYSETAIGQLLADQIVSPVRWLDSVERVLAHGDVEFREVGEGTKLMSMVRRIFWGP